jgi:uncharacterized protein (DUF305 family)
MQINIDKKTGILISIIVGLLLIIGLISFGSVRDHDRDSDHMGMHGQSQGQMMNTGENTFTGSDIMFAQMMIPHHQQAIEMSDLAIKISKNSKLIDLAKQIKAEQAPEITQMRNWLTAANASETMDHSMGMGGMLSDSEISTLSKSTGKTFDSLFLKGMIAHHEGAIHMVMMIEDSSNTEVRALGDAIVKSQSAEIFLMKDLLKTL